MNSRNRNNHCYDVMDQRGAFVTEWNVVAQCYSVSGGTSDSFTRTTIAVGLFGDSPATT